MSRTSPGGESIPKLNSWNEFYGKLTYSALAPVNTRLPIS